MSSYQLEFEKTLSNRNEQQLKAIRTIDGPVLVFAGPGTGKTDVLSLRIGNILHSTDTLPSNILCLTYTDSGASAMRKRLIKYIGPAAYQVSIHTFHSFCGEVIAENAQYFGGYQELQLVSDIYRLRILKKVIDEFDIKNPLRRLTGDKYQDVRKLGGLFEDMKREGWSSDFMISKIETYIDEARDYEEFRYKRKYRNFKAGDLKENLYEKDVIKPMALLASACQAFERYEYFMHEHKYFDYTDMLLWTKNAFENHSDLLLTYQEKYLYFLIDEFQDTNGTQLNIIDLLAKYWDQPNLFVVGDDDQSIYRFQGASKENIKKFKKDYSPQEIILNQNYRSSQNILDTTNELIINNKDRLVNNLPGELKKLKASGDYASDQSNVRIVQYPNVVLEEVGVATELIKLHNDGKILNKESVAVIYRNHKHADNIIRALVNANIPINIKKRVNVLDEPLVQNCITLLSYLSAELREPNSTEFLLFEILHFRFFNISAQDIGRTMIYYRRFKNRRDENYADNKLNLRELIRSTDHLKESEVENQESFLNFSDSLNYWLDHYFEFTSQVFFEDIINRSGLLDWALKSDKSLWNLQLINTLFDLIKTESVNNSKISLDEIVGIIKEMEDNRLQLPLNHIVQSENGIQFMTAHGSKGLEFDRVYMIKAENKKWDNAPGNNMSFKYPKNLVEISANSANEDERRLFYVAMTRCKYELNISFAESKSDGKPITPTLFVNEITEGENVSLESKDIDGENVEKYLINLMKPQVHKTQLIDKKYIDVWLSGYSLSVTGLNKYLRCPRAFYYEDILKVPGARNVYMGFGNAIHYALQQFFNRTPLGSNEDLTQHFKMGMKKYISHFTDNEFADRLIFGKNCLQLYYDTYHSNWGEAITFKTEYKIQNVFSEGIPITGNIDRVDKNKLSVDITDYKTGSYKSEKMKAPDEKSPLGGDYWRQLVFYKILLQEDPTNNWAVNNGFIDFIQPDKSGKFIRKSYQITTEDISFVKKQISDTYDNIKNYQFGEGCEDEKCTWCKLVNSHEEK